MIVALLILAAKGSTGQPSDMETSASDRKKTPQLYRKPI